MALKKPNSGLPGLPGVSGQPVQPLPANANYKPADKELWGGPEPEVDDTAPAQEPRKVSLPGLPPMSGGAAAQKPGKTHHIQFDLSQMLEDELVKLHQAVLERLPRKSLKDLDLAQELVLQLISNQALQKETHESNDVPANQKAQVANSVSSAIGALVRLQASVYSSERFKRIEQILLDCLRDLPPENQQRFIEQYEQLGMDENS